MVFTCLRLDRSRGIENKTVSASVESHPKAEEGNGNHVPAPMPGVVSSIAVQEGQNVQKGELLLTVEAMKMETSINAEINATIKRIAVKPGAQVDAKDLLVELA